MQRVRKTFFDPLATSKAQIREILEGLPVGSAHPFSPERILLCRTDHGIDEIDVSSYPEEFFFNAVDLGEMGEVLLRRMAGFQNYTSVFKDFQIQQAPASTFKIPLISDQITILAVSERTPTYYDFCFADASYNACCWLARNTFPGISHSGDITVRQDLLDYVTINKETLTEKEICVFISGYQKTPIAKFLGTHPALLVADHVDKILYIIPVPLDTATIGDATICCPLVIKRDGDSLICSILPTATTDREMMCSSNKLMSTCFPEAIERADFTISAPLLTPKREILDAAPRYTFKEISDFVSESLQIIAKENAILTTNLSSLPSFLDLAKAQIINFGTGLEFQLEGALPTNTQSSSVVLPCIFGSQLQGPLLLATGTVPSNVPFDQISLQDYYNQLNNILVVVDDRMTDNARNLATSYRINALFIVQLSPQTKSEKTDDVLSLLNAANINAVTALAGPQSLILVQIFEKLYFYRGLANRAYINTAKLAFGSDVTSVIESVGLESILDPRAKRVVNLDDANTIILPVSDQLVRPQDLQKLFEKLPVDKITDLEEDISAAVPQLQILLSQKDLQELSKSLVSALCAKISNATAPLRKTYIEFLTQEYQNKDPESMKKKSKMLGNMRKSTMEWQKAFAPVISSLANMMTSQTTSKRTHDLKRLIRQAQIQGNVAAAKSMTFDTLAGYLETYAGDMGVMLLNIETTPYQNILGNLNSAAIDASSCCNLDSRILHLEGFDAGIIMEQSQSDHHGPLQSQSGPSQPVLAVPCLSPGMGSGSMLAWICWDEFVNLKSPFTVRWMEKCNEAHIAALRIMMRSTLSQAVASREHNIQPGSPEAGHLMSALLMAAMSKLAARRLTTPGVLENAEDTVTKLMRGLFGNLLTIAGSGVRPLSMVWQLFGVEPNFDLPTSDVEWIWYETVVALYPYTGWPLKQFHENLAKLLDKAIIRVVTKNEKVAEIKMNRTLGWLEYCQLRNIQLEHSRTIITILMRMLTTENINVAAVAARLLEQLPQILYRQTQSYTDMIKYLDHLARGGQRRGRDDLTASSVFTKRSAAFAELKANVSEACERRDWVKVKESCQALLDKHAEIAALWKVKPGVLKIQNMKAYKDLLNTNFGDDIDQDTKIRTQKIVQKVLNDAEKKRVPWQIGNEGEYGNNIEPLNEAFLHHILSGEKSDFLATSNSHRKLETSTPIIEQKPGDGFSQFGSSLKSAFVSKMEQNLSAEEVCGIIKVPVTAMRVFAKALNLEFVWDDLGGGFKAVILDLLKDRSGRAESCPTRKLFELGSGKGMMHIER